MPSRYRAVVKKAEILSALGVSSAVLSVAACISGQDHVRGIPGYGMTKALGLLRGMDTAGKTAEQLLAQLPTVLPDSRDAAVRCHWEGVRLLQWYKVGGVTRPAVSQQLSARPSFVDKFLWEKDPNNNDRRLGLAQKICKAIVNERLGIPRPTRFSEAKSHEKFWESARAERKDVCDRTEFITEVLPAIPRESLLARNRYFLFIDGR